MTKMEGVNSSLSICMKSGMWLDNLWAVIGDAGRAEI
jgi:hypothetical protein